MENIKTFKLTVSKLSAILLLSSVAFAETKIVALGDSLTEGYGISDDKAYPRLLEDRLKSEGRDVKIINAGVSGSTTASAVGRLKWQLKNKPDILIIALGANDGLRGLPAKQIKKNLLDTIELAKKNRIKILFVGMKMPPNYGKKFEKEYETLFQEIAQSEKLEFVPFLLEGVAGVPKLNLADGIHPNEEGHKILSETIYKHLKKLL